jgi:hypothetical protein
MKMREVRMYVTVNCGIILGGQWEPGGTTKCSELAFQDWTGHFTTAGKLPRGTDAELASLDENA